MKVTDYHVHDRYVAVLNTEPWRLVRVGAFIQAALGRGLGPHTTIVGLADRKGVMVVYSTRELRTHDVELLEKAWEDVGEGAVQVEVHPVHEWPVAISIGADT